MRTEVDTVDAYRRTMEVSPPPWPNIDELREIDKYSFLSQEEIAEILAREERLLGAIALSSDFFKRRTNFMESSEVFAQEAFTKLAPQLCISVAEYFSQGGNFQQHELETIFNTRLKAVDRVFLGDPLFTPSVGASYFASYGLVRVNAKALEMVQLGEKPLEDYFVNTILAHELLHVMLTSARTIGAMEKDGQPIDLITRNGLVTSHLPNEGPVSRPSELIEHLSWVNEAFIEDVRQRILNTQAGAYPMKLAVLRTLQLFDPQLELTLSRVAITSVPPSHVTQRIEDILGPLGSEYVEDITSQRAAWENPLIAENMIMSIASLFPKSIKTQAVSELFRQWRITKQHLLV